MCIFVCVWFDFFFSSFICKTCFSRRRQVIPEEASANLARKMYFYSNPMDHSAISLQY